MPNRGRGMRQRKHWHGTGAATENRVNFTANSTAAIASLGFPSDPGTILRTLGEVLVSPTGDGTFAAQDAARVTFGITIIFTDALAGAVFPDPASEPEFDWLWWYTTTVNFEGSVDAPGQEVAMTSRISFDSRAMRKFKPGVSIVLIGQYVNINGSPPLSVDGGFR